MAMAFIAAPRDSCRAVRLHRAGCTRKRRPRHDLAREGPGAGQSAARARAHNHRSGRAGGGFRFKSSAPYEVELAGGLASRRALDLLACNAPPVRHLARSRPPECQRRLGRQSVPLRVPSRPLSESARPMRWRAGLLAIAGARWRAARRSDPTVGTRADRSRTSRYCARNALHAWSCALDKLGVPVPP